jgi:hypothetical protein
MNFGIGPVLGSLGRTEHSPLAIDQHGRRQALHVVPQSSEAIGVNVNRQGLGMSRGDGVGLGSDGLVQANRQHGQSGLAITLGKSL